MDAGREELVHRLLADALVRSASMARRLIVQGAVQVNGTTVHDMQAQVAASATVQVGRGQAGPPERANWDQGEKPCQ